MASKRRLRRRECSRKVVQSQEEAHIAAKRMWKVGKRVHAYKCRFGGHWHVGHF